MRLRPLLALSILMSAAGAGRAQTIYGATAPNASGVQTLVRFDASNPSSTNLGVTALGQITGITAGQTLQDIDFRASNGVLYGLSTSAVSLVGGVNTVAAQLYTINLANGQASVVGSPISLATDNSRLSIDFNPVVDALRVITSSNQNYVVNANTGAVARRDTDITRPSDPSGVTPVGLAYTNNFRGATSTTLYAYEFNASSLNTVGAVGGGTGNNSPNAGVLNPVGPTGVAPASTLVGFDITDGPGTAYLALDDATSARAASELYTVNLATGAATLISALDDLPSLIGISVQPVPEPATALLAGVAGAGLVARLRRRRAVVAVA